MRRYSHDINVDLLHKVREYHIANMAFVGVHNEEIWSVQHSVAFQPPHKAGTILMKFLFGYNNPLTSWQCAHQLVHLESMVIELAPLCGLPWDVPHCQLQL